MDGPCMCDVCVTAMFIDDSFMHDSVGPSWGVEPARLRCPFCSARRAFESRHAGHVAGGEAPCCRHVLAGPIQHLCLYDSVQW